MEFWEGLRFGAHHTESHATIEAMTGIRTIQTQKELWPTLIQHLKKSRTHKLYIPWFQSVQNPSRHQKDQFYAFRRQVSQKLRVAGLTIPIENLMPHIWSLLLHQDAVSIDLFETANQKMKKAFEHTLSKLSQFHTETDVMGALNGELLTQSHFGLSFPSIVASGPNAGTLHYTRNNSPLHKNRLLLLDFGIRWHTINGDVSRTIPISGKFNPLQKLLYELVLDTQAKVESHAKAGITIQKLNTICWTHLETLLKKHIKEKGGKVSRPYPKIPHNVSHLIGFQVHEGDPFREYRTQPLEAGWVISNEPGLYGTFELTIQGKRYHETLGIRIEDDLLITKNRAINLSQQIPKSIREIENLWK